VPAPSSYLPARDVVARILIWAGVAACAAGFVAHRMWTWLPAARFGGSVALAALVSLLAGPLRRCHVSEERCAGHGMAHGFDAGTRLRAGFAHTGAYPRMTVDEAQWWHVPEAAAR
jgi:hypothetical protein